MNRFRRHVTFCTLIILSAVGSISGQQDYVKSTSVTTPILNLATYFNADGSAIIATEDSLEVHLTLFDSSGTELWQFKYANDYGRIYLGRCGNNYIVSGKGGSSDSTYICAINASGQLQWVRRYQWAQSNIAAIACDSNGIYIAGDPGIASYHGYVMKLDPVGNLIWRRVYNFAGAALNMAFNTSTQRLAISQIDSPSLGAVMEIDTSGAVTHSFFVYCIASAVAPYTDGGWVVAGSVNAWPGTTRVIRLDSTGNKIWSSDISPCCIGDVGALSVSPSGNIYMGMHFLMTTPTPSIALLKFDSVGNLLWSRRSILVGVNMYMGDLRETSYGMLMTSGRVGQNVWIARSDTASVFDCLTVQQTTLTSAVNTTSVQFLQVVTDSLAVTALQTSGAILVPEIQAFIPSCYTGVEETAESDFAFSPNPAHELLEIRNDGFSVLKIYSMTGTLITTSVLSEGDNAIELTGMSPGIYLVVLEGDRNRRSARKLIVQ